MRLLLIAILTCLASRPLEAQVERTGLPAIHGFFVIGPDSLGVRPWTSTWLAATLSSAPLDSTVRLWDWEELLVNLLDIHHVEKIPEAPPPGPSALSGLPMAAVYPWDLRRELPEYDQIFLRRVWAMKSLVQVVVEFNQGGYRLRVIDVRATDPVSVVRYTVSEPSLKLASEHVAERIAVDWQRSAQTSRR